MSKRLSSSRRVLYQRFQLFNLYDHEVIHNLLWRRFVGYTMRAASPRSIINSTQSSKHQQVVAIIILLVLNNVVPK